MDRLEIVDISTLLRSKPLNTPLCKKRIRAWNQKVQSVARSPKTPDPLDSDSHVPPVARAPRQNTPQPIAPSFSQLQIVDISTLPRGNPLETPLCKKRIRAWNPKVQSVARSPKTVDTTADDDVAPVNDSHVPPVARAPRQNTPQLIAPSFSQLEIVDISSLPRGKPLETPLCKQRIRAWNPKMQSVARSPKTLDTTADDDVAPDTDSHVAPVASSSSLKKSPPSIAPSFIEKVQSVARSPKTLDTTADHDVAPDSHVPQVAKAPRQNTPQLIAPNFSQLEIVDISTLLRGKSLETPLGKKRKRAWSPKVRSVGWSTKRKVTPVVNEATPAINSCLTPAAGFSHRRRSQPIHKLEIVDISTLPRSKPLESRLSKNRKRAWSPKVQSVGRSPKTPDPPVDDDVATDTNSSLPPEASPTPPKKIPLSLATNICNLEIVDMSTPPISKQLETPLYMKKRGWIMKVKIVGRSTKGKVTPVVNEATPATNSCLTPEAGFSRRRQNRPIPKNGSMGSL